MNTGDVAADAAYFRTPGAGKSNESRAAVWIADDAVQYDDAEKLAADLCKTIAIMSSAAAAAALDT